MLRDFEKLFPKNGNPSKYHKSVVSLVFQKTRKGGLVLFGPTVQNSAVCSFLARASTQGGGLLRGDVRCMGCRSPPSALNLLR